jgi:PAS domain S-box-containing protein
VSGEKPEADDILDHVADGVYHIDKGRRITSWNKAAERITGFTAEEVRGKCCSECILTHVDDKGVSLCKAGCPLSYTLIDGEHRETIVNLHHKEGYRIPVHITVNPVRDDSGQVVGAVETFRECSDVMALRSSIDRLKQWGCVDVVSGLPNRRIADWQLNQRVQEMQA